MSKRPPGLALQPGDRVRVLPSAHRFAGVEGDVAVVYPPTETHRRRALVDFADGSAVIAVDHLERA